MRDAPEVVFIQCDNVIEALAPDRTDHALYIAVLPGRACCRRRICDGHGPDPIPEHFTVCRMPVMDQIPGRLVPWKGLGDLPSSPGRRRVRGDGKVNHPAPTVAEDNQDKENAEAQGRYHQEIDGSSAVPVVAQEGPPGLIWIRRSSGQVP